MPDIALFGCTMDIDASREGVAILWFKTFQPDDSSHDRVSAGSIRRQHFASSPPTFENRPERCARTDLYRHFHSSEGRRTAAGSISQPEPGGRNRIAS